MRRRIDMTEVEAATKIRAKYLRALENEEWDLLPGPTFVKTFLRTYAEYLELDPRMLVEEYRQRYERPSTQDLTPFGPGMGGSRRRRQRPRRSLGAAHRRALRRRAAARRALPARRRLGRRRPRSEAPPVASPTADRHRDARPRPRSRRRRRRRRRRPRAPSLRLTAKSARVYVCLVDATGKAVVNGEYLEPGKSTRTFRSQRFRMNLGNSEVTLRVGRQALFGGQHRQADRLRGAAGEEAHAAVGGRAPETAVCHMSVRAGIIVTGTEVLSGIIRDANGPWLSEALRARGVVVSHIVVVGDRPDDLRGALDFLSDHDLVLTSGGLGPTADDLTADVVAEWAGAEMVHDPALEERIWAVVSAAAAADALRRGGDAGGRAQAGVRARRRRGAGAGRDRAGAARGSSGPLVAVLPGPPRELQTMWADAVDDVAAARAAGVRGVVGAADPALLPAARAADRGDAARDRRGAVRGHHVPAARRARGGDGVRAGRGGGVCVVRGGAARAARRRPVLRRRRDDRRGRSRGCSPGSTIATAESCTGGLMAGRLTDLAGSSAYVLGGLVVYSNEAKTALAGVPASLIEAHGAVSPEVATALSAGARSRLGADIRDRHHRRRRPGRRLGGEAGRHRLHLGLQRHRRRGAHRAPARAAAPTSATAPPPSRSTCSGRSCCAHDRRTSTSSRPAGNKLALAARLRPARPRRCGSSSPSTSPTTSATPSPRSAPPPTRTSGAPSRPRRCTSRSPSSAAARRRTSTAIAPIVAAEHDGAAARARRRPAAARRAAPASSPSRSTTRRARCAELQAPRRRPRSPTAGVYTPESAPVPPARHGRPPASPRARPPRTAALAPRSHCQFSAAAVTLYASRLHPSGARYEALARAPLG